MGDKTLLFPEEQVLRDVILPDLDKGRPDFDRPHTEAVVYWMKEICVSEPQLNTRVLVTAAYAHDWGYIGMFEDGVTDVGDIHDKKEAHMRIGSQKIGVLLRENLADGFSETEIARVQHLVFVHDRLDTVKDDDEIAMVEADTLGALDADRVKPTLTRKDNDWYIEDQVKRLRRPLFRHSRAIEVFQELLQKRIDFYFL
jgi:hypothetical protein